VRDKIDTTLIVRKLAGHIEGSQDMTATQIQAARILLDRTVPVLKAVEITNSSEIKDITHLSAHQLLDFIDGESTRK
jgi:hypothetical protein